MCGSGPNSWTLTKKSKARPMAMWLSTCLHIGLSFSSPRRASNATGWRTLSGLVILLSGAHCSLNHTDSLDKKCRFLLTPKTLALKEYFPLTSTDGPWLIRSAHFAQKKCVKNCLLIILSRGLRHLRRSSSRWRRSGRHRGRMAAQILLRQQPRPAVGTEDGREV